MRGTEIGKHMDDLESVSAQWLEFLESVVWSPAKWHWGCASLKLYRPTYIQTKK